MSHRVLYLTRAQGLGIRDYSTCNRITVIPKITTNLLVTVETAISLHMLSKAWCLLFGSITWHEVKRKSVGRTGINISFTHLKIMAVMSSTFG